MFLILSSKKPVCFSCATGCWGKGHLSTHEPEYLLSDQEHGLPPHWPPWRETSPRGKWVWKKNETFWSSATAVQRFSYRNELKRFGYLLQDSFPFIFLLLSSSAGPVFPAGLLLCYLPSHQAIADLFATEVRLFARLLLKTELWAAANTNCGGLTRSFKTHVTPLLRTFPNFPPKGNILVPCSFFEMLPFLRCDAC